MPLLIQKSPSFWQTKGRFRRSTHVVTFAPVSHRYSFQRHKFSYFRRHGGAFCPSVTVYVGTMMCPKTACCCCPLQLSMSNAGAQAHSSGEPLCASSVHSSPVCTRYVRIRGYMCMRIHIHLVYTSYTGIRVRVYV